MAYIVGLTGGIGSGKTTVANRLAERGAHLIDTDLIAHALTAPGGQALPALVQEFGTHLLTPDGALNRPYLRDLVFADPEQRRTLEGILHPLIFAEAQAACARLAALPKGEYGLLIVPLLVETGTRYRALCQRILVVDCPEATQLERVMHRNQLDASRVRQMLAAQASRSERLAIADDIVCNDGSPAELDARLTHLHAQYQLAASL